VVPTLALAQGNAAAAYSMLLQDTAAMRAANRALRSDRTANNLVQRAEVRPWSDATGRRSDIEAALKLDPASIRALMALGELEARLGNHGAARDAFTRLLEQDADEYLRGRALVLRGIEFLKLEEVNAADKDFDAYLQPMTNPTNFNNLCWEMMIANVALSRAAGYCDRAVELKPDSANYQDSKATLFLRQGEWDKAIQVYDEALKLDPKKAHSLYGRGVASQERCRCETGITDLQKALNLRSDVQRSYERMGFDAPYPAASVLQVLQESPYRIED
jgi:tetratricopeptide (TPR) repeat protein